MRLVGAEFTHFLTAVTLIDGFAFEFIGSGCIVAGIIDCGWIVSYFDRSKLIDKFGDDFFYLIVHSFLSEFIEIF